MPKTITKHQISKIYEAHKLGMNIFDASQYADVDRGIVERHWKERKLKAHFKGRRRKTDYVNTSKNNSNKKDNYDFRKPLRRITFEKQIPYLFDKNWALTGIDEYSGKINGIEARIIFSSESSCMLCTKTENGLNKAYYKALERTNINFLQEILTSYKNLSKKAPLT